MAEQSYPFSSSPVSTELQWSRMARWWQLDGVLAETPTGNELKVTANGTASVTVEVGAAYVNGFGYFNDAPLPLTVPSNAGSVLARLDLVILRCSMSANAVTVVYLQGGTTLPALSTDRGDVYEIPLAKVVVAGGATTVSAGSVTDYRVFSGRPVAVGQPAFRRPGTFGQLMWEGKQLLAWAGTAWSSVQMTNRPLAIAYQTGSGQVLAHDNAQDLIWTAVTVDSDSMHSGGADPAPRRLTCNTPGLYRVDAGVSFPDDHPTGYRSLAIVKNFTAYVARCVVPSTPAGNETAIQCGGWVQLAAGDYLTARAAQGSTGSLAVNTGPDRTFISAEWKQA